MVAKGRTEGWHIIFLKKFSTSQSRSRTEEPVPLGGENNCQASFCKKLSFCPKWPQPSLFPLLALHQWDWVMWSRRTTMVGQRVTTLKRLCANWGSHCVILLHSERIGNHHVFSSHLHIFMLKYSYLVKLHKTKLKYEHKIPKPLATTRALG